MIATEVIEAAVRATPGVTSVFACAISDTDVSVSIGVATATQAPETAAAAAAAIRLLAPDAIVSVRVGRVA